VFALFNPARYELQTFHKYDIKRLNKYYRAVHMLKNRDGEADKMVSMGFLGEIGMFFELPKIQDMTEEHYKRFENFQKQHNK
jgi:hypothetical protein